MDKKKKLLADIFGVLKRRKLSARFGTIGFTVTLYDGNERRTWVETGGQTVALYSDGKLYIYYDETNYVFSEPTDEAVQIFFAKIKYVSNLYHKLRSDTAVRLTESRRLRRERTYSPNFF